MSATEKVYIQQNHQASSIIEEMQTANFFHEVIGMNFQQTLAYYPDGRRSRAGLLSSHQE